MGTQYCYNCGRKVQKQTTDQIIDSIMRFPQGTRINILAPVVKGRKGHYRELFEEIVRDGFIRVRVDGSVREIQKGMQLDRYKVHNIEIVVDRIVVKKEGRARVADSVEVALKFGSGVLIVSQEGVGASDPDPPAIRKKGEARSSRKTPRSSTPLGDTLFSR
ncbi:MAG: uvrA, partial [Bacteroidetes bacterium]|nr:uvrA [Bacteroidota bacterium]